MIAPLLVSCCDTGSANALVPVLPGLSCPYRLFAQPDAARVFDRCGFEYQPLALTGWDDLQEAGRQVFSEVGPKAVLTGTSWGPSIDKALILAAREKGIPCASLVEHWDLYMERFSVVEGGHIQGRASFLPDRIWVNDSTAKAEAVAAGLPAAIIEAVGQPHLEMQIKAFRGIQGRPGSEGIVFVSERIRGDFVQGSPLDRGFDEYQALEQLLQVIDLSATPLLVKLHPQEEEGKFDALIGGRENVRAVKKADNVALIAGAKHFVGMFSMLLLEAALVRSDVISFMPGGDASIFVGNRLGATHPATTRADLTRLLADLPTQSAGDRLHITPFGKQFVGSAARMTEAIERMMQ